MTNVILWNDVATGDSSTAEIFYQTGTASISSGVVDGGCPANPSILCDTIYTTDPKLAPLADIGGFTPTMLPGLGSSAIDTGLDSACPNIDQRGLTRPQGPHCEIGAVEVLVIQPPVAEPLSVTMPMNTSKEITLIGMDSNPGGPFTFSFAVTTRPAHGGFTGLAGVLNYTPDVNYVGPDTFEYTVTDANGTSLPAAVTITVTGVIPVVQPMSFTTPMNVSKTITLTATDSNAGGPFTFTFAAAAPLHGTVSVSGDTAAYLPDVNYTGPDSFTYTATDVNGTSLPAIVTITVTSVPPVAEPRSIVVPHNTSKQITFAATDSNVGGPFTYSFTPVSSPAHGTLGTTVGNVVTYTPTHDYSGPDTFDYTATDANGTSIPVTVTITVLPVGGGPLPPGTTAIPALNAWGLLALAGLIGLTPLGRKRKI
jgi:hypothetical protein